MKPKLAYRKALQQLPKPVLPADFNEQLFRALESYEKTSTEALPPSKAIAPYEQPTSNPYGQRLLLALNISMLVLLLFLAQPQAPMTEHQYEIMGSQAADTCKLMTQTLNQLYTQ